MKQVRTKFAKGTILYNYRGRSYLEMVDGTYIDKMLYDEENNVTNIYLKKNYFLLETFLSLLIILILILMWSGYYVGKQTVYYSSTIYCYNKQLYLNIENSKDAYVPIECELVIGGNVYESKSLMPGEQWIVCPYNGEKLDKVILRVTFDYPLFKKVIEEDCFIINK